MQIPPVRIVRGGTLELDVLAILKANMRLPDSLWAIRTARSRHSSSAPDV